MTKFESKRINPDWDAILQWEDKNNGRVMWVVTSDCIRERMKETNQDFKVSKDLILEFITHSRRGWDMEAFKNAFKDFVIQNLKEEINESIR